MSHLLDTNICAAHFRRPAGLAHRLIKYGGSLFVPTIVRGELYAGAYHSSKGSRADASRSLRTMPRSQEADAGRGAVVLECLVAFPPIFLRKLGQLRSLAKLAMLAKLAPVES